MIFKQADAILRRQKRQTRRLVEGGERLASGFALIGKPAVIRESGGVRWQVGHTYAVQPGRGQKAVGRIRITKIRRERLQDITEDDAKAEGANIRDLHGMDYIPGWQSLSTDLHFPDHQRVCGYRGAFAQLWDEFYPREGNWLENPNVWVLDFEVVEEHDA